MVNEGRPWIISISSDLVPSFESFWSNIVNPLGSFRALFVYLFVCCEESFFNISRSRGLTMFLLYARSLKAAILNLQIVDMYLFEKTISTLTRDRCNA